MDHWTRLPSTRCHRLWGHNCPATERAGYAGSHKALWELVGHGRVHVAGPKA
jgi:hypothetical protein